MLPSQQHQPHQRAPARLQVPRLRLPSSQQHQHNQRAPGRLQAPRLSLPSMGPRSNHHSPLRLPSPKLSPSHSARKRSYHCPAHHPHPRLPFPFPSACCAAAQASPALQSPQASLAPEKTTNVLSSPEVLSPPWQHPAAGQSSQEECPPV